MSGYLKLPKSSEEDMHDEEESQHSTQPYSRYRLLPWIWCALCSIITVLAVLNSSLRQYQTPENAGNLFPTDFVSAPNVPYIERYFYNYYDFNPQTHVLELNRSMMKVGPLYSGYPSPKIDAAWEELLEGSYMEASEEEIEAVKKVAPWDLEEVSNHTYLEMGVFHNLHCIDLLRRALNPEIYNVHTDFSGQLAQKYRQSHIYHCIDHLRQAVQCQGDLTPVPMFSIPQLPGFFASHSISHTCRDFEAIMQWRSERNSKKEPFSY